MKTIYLDQSHLSNLARGVGDLTSARRFKELCTVGDVSPVFSMVHVYETWNHPNLVTRNRIAAYADSLPNPKWILSRHILTEKEINKAFFKFHGSPQQPINVFRQKLKHILYENMKGAIEIVIRDYGFTETFAEIAQDRSLQENFQEWKTIDASYPSVKLLLSGAVVRRGAADVIAELRTRYASFIAEEIPTHLPNGEIASVSQKGAFVQHALVEAFQSCPTVHVMLRVDEEIARDISSRAEPSQFPDLIHLSALPYVDLFLCDNRIRDYVRRAKLPAAISNRCFGDLGEALARL